MRVHHQCTVFIPRPVAPRTIPIQFDAVLIWVVEIQRFTDAMIRGAVECNPSLLQSVESVCQCGAIRIQNGDVVQSRGTGRRGPTARALPRVEPNVMVVPTRANESCLRSHTCREFEAKYTAVKLQGPFEVGDSQVDVSNRDPRINGGVHDP